MLLPLPACLLKQLVDEWQWITKKGLLPPLPRRPCVDELLDQYKVKNIQGWFRAGGLRSIKRAAICSALRVAGKPSAAVC